MNPRAGFLIALTAAVVCLAVAYFWRPDRNPPNLPIISTGGEILQIKRSAAQHFSQTDPGWANETIGGSRESLRSVGCTICSVAMALTGLGVEITPGELNEELKKKNGYTSDGWLIWSAVTAVEPSAQIDVIPQPAHQLIDDALKRGDYPIVKFLLRGGIPHWVLIVGKDGQEYLTLDPLTDARQKFLSDLTYQIYSLRILRKR